MADIHSILAIYDPTRKAALAEQPAVARAGELAATLDARLQVFLCDYNQYLSGERFFDSPGLQKSRDSYIENRKVLVDRVVEELKGQGVNATAEAVWDTPLNDGIVRQVLRTSPDLVVKDTHPHARIQRAIFTNTDWHLLRDCPAPLLLVKAGVGEAKGPVIAAVDPMHDFDKPAALDKRIVGLAQVMAAADKTDVHLFHAYQTVIPVPSGVPVGVEPVVLPLDLTDAKIRTAHEREFKALREATGIGEDKAHLVDGDTREALFDLIGSLNAGLVVMGAISRGRLERLFLGSTAERVLGDVACDVLTVKPEGFESPVKL